MENIYHILGSGLVIALTSIMGILVIKSHKKIAAYVNTNLTGLTAVSAGVFLVTSSLLARETLEILPLEKALLAFALGIFSYLLLHKIIAPHRHMGDTHRHGKDDKKSAWKILIGDALHNIADGLLLVASFGASVTIGLSNTLSIILHEVPQEISEFLVLRKSGYSNREAIYRNFATALSIFIGVILGIFIVRTEILQAYLLGATATFFLGIVFTDLFPVRMLAREQKLGKMSVALIIGVAAMTGIQSALPHSHEHGHEHEHHEPDENHNGDDHEHESHSETEIEYVNTAHDHDKHHHHDHDDHD
jgi:zinc and cadmium transporter